MLEKKELKKTKTVKKSTVAKKPKVDKKPAVLKKPAILKKEALKKIAQPLELSDLIKESLEDNKAENIVVIDLKDKTNIADYMIVASGTSSRHVLSLADNLVVKLKKHKIIPRVEGKQQADWILIDAINVIVHIFRPEVRQYYNLEKMWSFANDLRSESKVG